MKAKLIEKKIGTVITMGHQFSLANPDNTLDTDSPNLRNVYYDEFSSQRYSEGQVGFVNVHQTVFTTFEPRVGDSRSCGFRANFYYIPHLQQGKKNA